MAVVVESGVGVRGANAYVDAAFVTAYLTERDRLTENGWGASSSAAKDARVIAATDYIEKRYGHQFKGARLTGLDSVEAEGSIAFTGLPVAAETVTVGDRTYTFRASLTGEADEVLIGSGAAATASNLYDALVANTDNEGTTYGEGTEANRHVAVELDTATLNLTATAPGAGGDETALSESATNVTVTAFAGGLDGGSQPLSFPRSGLYDGSGRPVYGVPLKLRQATAEYAVRALSATLAPDPTVDAQGGSIKSLSQTVGPISEEVEYVEGTHLSFVFKPYPAADALLTEYLTSGAGAYGSMAAIRG